MVHERFTVGHVVVTNSLTLNDIVNIIVHVAVTIVSYLVANGCKQAHDPHRRRRCP